MKKRNITFIILILVIIYWWVSSAPPSDLQIGNAYQMGEVPAAILAVEGKTDFIKDNLTYQANGISGYDDVAFDISGNIAYVSSMEGWIWKINTVNSTSEKLAKVPLIPTGIQLDPTDSNTLFFCVSRMGGVAHPDNEKVGLYALNIKKKSINPVVLRLPKVGKNAMEITFLPSERPKMQMAEMNEENSREFCLCNDLAISKDGQRIYMSEPVPLPRASMGSGAVIEAIGLAPIGKMWMYDRSDNSVSLVVDNFTFVDGLILEHAEGDSIESAVIFTETTKFRMFKSYFTGKNAGTSELLWDNLPGMPDGLDRDSNGNIWVGLLKKRSNIIVIVHKNPWLKSLFLRVPQKWLPVTKDTGILAFSPDGKTPLYFTMHSGVSISDISVVTPFEGRLYFPVFSIESKGLYSMSSPIVTILKKKNL